MTMPGGCRLGPRPIDIHLEGLACMGAAAEWKGEQLTLSAPRGLYGAEFALRLPSVGATETLMMAAVKAKGVAVSCGAAREPEVVDLARFLMAARGAHLRGGHFDDLDSGAGAAQRRGVPPSDRPDRGGHGAGRGGRHRRKRDPAALCAGASGAGGGLLTRGGCAVRREGPAALTLAAPARLAGAGWVTAGAYPAFPTDAARLWATAPFTAAGPSYLRIWCLSTASAARRAFRRWAAGQRCGGGCWNWPRPTLPGQRDSGRLRGGAALAVAALQAQGESAIARPGCIRRGYGDLAALLRSLGARAEWEGKPNGKTGEQAKKAGKIFFGSRRNIPALALEFDREICYSY